MKSLVARLFGRALGGKAAAQAGASLRLHGLADNRRLSRRAFDAMVPGIATLERLHRGMRDYVKAQALDPEVFLPGNIWKDLCNLDSFQHWSYELVNVIKIVSPFTGTYMVLWGRMDSGELEADRVNTFFAPILAEGSVENLDGLLESEFGVPQRMRASAPSLLGTYDALVDPVPARHRITTPDRMGEMGIVHRGNIINHDLLTYQSRINALYGGGVLEQLEDRVGEGERVSVLEIGPGHCFMAYALQAIFHSKLQVFLVDLPSTLVHGYCYLTGIFGVDDVQIVTEATTQIEDKPFVLIPHFLLPRMAPLLGSLELALNAMSFNEMSAPQVAFYLDFVAAKLRPGGIFHLDGGQKIHAYHQDALAMAKRKLGRHECFERAHVKGIPTITAPNTLFYR